MRLCRAFVHGLAMVFLLGFTIALLPVLGAELTQTAETAKQFIKCTVPLEHRISFLGWRLGQTFEGTAVLIARVEVGGETYDLWTAPAGTYDARVLLAENTGKPVLAVIEPIPLPGPGEWLRSPELVITPPTNLTPLAALCSLPPHEDLEEPEKVVIVGFDKKGDKLVRFVSFAKPGVGSMQSFGYEGDLFWEHKRHDVAGALVLTWESMGNTTQDFVPIGTYGPWEYESENIYTQETEIVHRDVEPLLAGVMSISCTKLPKARAFNVVRAAFGLELKPETPEPELEW